MQMNFERALDLSNLLEDHEISIKCLWALYASHIRLGNAFSAAKYANQADQRCRMCRTTTDLRLLESQLDILRHDAAGGYHGARAAALHMKLGDCYVKSEPFMAVNHFQVVDCIPT